MQSQANRKRMVTEGDLVTTELPVVILVNLEWLIYMYRFVNKSHEMDDGGFLMCLYTPVGGLWTSHYGYLREPVVT